MPAANPINLKSVNDLIQGAANAFNALAPVRQGAVDQRRELDANERATVSAHARHLRGVLDAIDPPQPVMRDQPRHADELPAARPAHDRSAEPSARPAANHGELPVEPAEDIAGPA